MCQKNNTEIRGRTMVPQSAMTDPRKPPITLPRVPEPLDFTGFWGSKPMDPLSK
jgi:hypothetical protein